MSFDNLLMSILIKHNSSRNLFKSCSDGVDSVDDKDSLHLKKKDYLDDSEIIHHDDSNTSSHNTLTSLESNAIIDDDYFFYELESNSSSYSMSDESCNTDNESICNSINESSSSSSSSNYKLKINNNNDDLIRVIEEYDDFDSTEIKYRSFEDIHGFQTVSCAVSGFRIVEKNGERYAEYKIIGEYKENEIKIWKRYTGFNILADAAKKHNMLQTINSWNTVQLCKDFFRNLTVGYLLSKKDNLDDFLERYLFECEVVDELETFLGVIKTF